MGAYGSSSARAVHPTTVAGQVDTVTLSDGTAEVEVLNRTGNGELYFTVDGTAPSVTADAGAGTGPSGISATGTDMAFTVNITTGTATASGQMFHTTAAISWSAAPHFNVSAGNSAAASLMAGGFWWTTTAAGSLQLSFVNAPQASTAYIFNVTAIQ